jgi:hypothetical protein
MTLVRSTPLRRTRESVPFHLVESIGLERAPDRETGIYSYRAVIRLAKGRRIRLYGETTDYARFDRILARLRELTGIGKEDSIQRPADQGARLRQPR